MPRRPDGIVEYRAPVGSIPNSAGGLSESRVFHSPPLSARDQLGLQSELFANHLLAGGNGGGGGVDIRASGLEAIDETLLPWPTGRIFPGLGTESVAASASALSSSTTTPMLADWLRLLDTSYDALDAFPLRAFWSTHTDRRHSLTTSDDDGGDGIGQSQPPRQAEDPTGAIGWLQGGLGKLADSDIDDEMRG